MNYEQAKALLAAHGQEHLLQYYDELSADEQSALLQTIATLLSYVKLKQKKLLKLHTD